MKFFTCFLLIVFLNVYVVSSASEVVQKRNDVPPPDNKLHPQDKPEARENTVRRLPNDEKAPSPNKVKTYSKNPMRLISASEECGDDVVRICGSRKYKRNNNFEILACLVNNEDNDGISSACNQYLWKFKLNVTQNLKYGRIAISLCRQALLESPECQSNKTDGRVISCLSERLDTIKEEACVSFLTKFQSIVFSDFHLICNFIDECKIDIEKFSCGSVEKGPEDGEFAHSQGQVVACLEKQMVKNSNSLQSSCFKQMIRIAELSADDYHLDRALYFKCRNDRENLCADVVAGQGKVYQCLFRHKFDSQMSTECREALTARQKVQAIDYKANSALLHECRREITKHHCNVSKSDDHLVHLSTVLLCLERSKRPSPLSDRCEHELIEFRRMLMEDYELSPEITTHCSAEIKEHCEGGTQQGEGKTIHCLMGLTRSESHPVNDACRDALSELLEETGALEDYRMDPVLVSACSTMISGKCPSDKTDDSAVLACLMDHIHDKDMKKKCKAALLDLQYFVSRDFMLDPNFREACSEEAKRNCDAYTGLKGNPVEFKFVLACLYARVHPNNGQEPLTPKCSDEVKRVIRQRALDFHLNPELEEKCRRDLSAFCSKENHEDNSEFTCLQDNFDKLDADCKKEVETLTRDESENFLDFDDILAKECEPMLQEFCQNEADNGDEGAVVECLISNKDRMKSKKCAAGVTHFQLIEMKNYNFNYKFTKSCKDDVKKHCTDFQDKPAVVECLSKLIRDRVLADDPKKVPEVSQKCREQLTVEKLQMHTNIKLNPKLHESCQEDYHRLCPGIDPGSAKVIECLREKQKKIKNVECRKRLFHFQKEEVDNPNLDFQLMRRCKSDILNFCPGFKKMSDAQKIFECLLENKEHLLKICKDVVREREKDMFDDIELNADLLKSCKKDIDKYCKSDFEAAKKKNEDGKDPEGIVYSCLIDVFTDESKSKDMSDGCYSHVEFVMKEEQRDYELNPSLMVACVGIITKLCPPETETNVIECLEEKFLQEKIGDHACMIEVAKILKEGRSDIQADPMLQESCSSDVIRFCHSVREGHGRVVRCLIEFQSSLSKECAQVLQERQQMWNHANKLRLNGFSDLKESILESEHASYLLSMITFLLILVLCTGALCGRVTKRVSADRKRQ